MRLKHLLQVSTSLGIGIGEREYLEVVALNNCFKR